MFTTQKLRFSVKTSATNILMREITASTFNAKFRHWRNRFSRKMNNEPSYYAKYYSTNRYFVKLAVVADHSMFLKYNENGTKILERIRAIVSHLNELYQPINLQITLVWTDIWTDRDITAIEPAVEKTAENFLAFHAAAMNTSTSSHTCLLTDVYYEAAAGIASMGTHCQNSSVSSIIDQDPNPKGIAITLAHEMGHSFGLQHDTENCNCPIKGHCIMNATTSRGSLIETWSECSLYDLRTALDNNFFPCLTEKPRRSDIFPRCGNGAVEEGEECDCGSTFSCQNKCCDPLTCKLTKNAKCAAGGCCDLNTCLPKPISTLCRNVTNVCDLPEYCDGKSFQCPDDFHVQNGLRCFENSDDFCYSGVCGNRTEKCKMYFGRKARTEKLCERFNFMNSIFGNCGYNPRTNKPVNCGIKDYSCGRLHCVNTSEKETQSRYYSTVVNSFTIKGYYFECTSLLPLYEGLDETLIGNGASCGENMMCVNQKCKNRTEEMMLLPQCKPRNCNNVGICNNVGNCHCKIGYGGIDCAVSGPGGSINSGPASVYHPRNLSQNQHGVISRPLIETYNMFWFLICLYIISIVLIYFIERKKLGSFLNGIWKRKAPRLQLSSISVVKEDIDIISLYSLKSAMEEVSEKSQFAPETRGSMSKLTKNRRLERPKTEMSSRTEVSPSSSLDSDSFSSAKTHM